MATLKLSETIADAIITKLQAGLAARVAAINTADTQGITIATPTLFLVSGTDSGIAPVEPAIVVTEYVVDGDLGRREHEGPHSFVYATHMAVGVFDLSTSRQELARKLWRQARAVAEVLWDDDPKEALTGSAFRLELARTLPGDVFRPGSPGGDETMWSGIYFLIFLCKQLEA